VKNIAIQGVRASFHDVATQKFFVGSETKAIECSTFRLLGEKLASGEADFAMMAIENTIAGSILPNYALLEANRFKIVGEVYLRIEMAFLALPGQKIADIRFVQSHPMAILQCQEFLSTLENIKIVEASDTAESALEIQNKKLKNHAAIASKMAGKTYGLEILKENIETDQQNFTRFLVLCREQDYRPPQDGNKASIRFETKHAPGSLALVLSDLSRFSVNMTKIQSIPILGKPYQYGFHVDLEWSNLSNYSAAMDELQKHTLNLIHFGEYQSGEKPFT